MFLLNVLIMLQLNVRSGFYHYVAVILPLALFLSALLMENAKVEYLILVGVSTFLLNSVVTPDFLRPQIFPFEVVGNVILTLGIVLMYFRPTAIIRTSKAR
jgi:general stress protein CsbA